MKIFISGICGKGMGPLALMASDAGFEVIGSDMMPDGDILPELKAHGIEVFVGEQTGDFLRAQKDIDWYVHTSAMKADHPEVKTAQELGLKISKRDELIEYLVKKLGLKMIAVAGTHGKTTTTAMIIYIFEQLQIPAAHLVGSTLGFAPAGSYKTGDKFFVYEADEFDRNFLAFHPDIAVLPSVTYDHAEIYPTQEDYFAAFEQFKSQSQVVIEDRTIDPRIVLVGEARRVDASMAVKAVMTAVPDVEEEKVIEIVNHFPGVGRRFEKIAEHVYSDYGHHPEEVETVIQIANEEAERLGLKGVVVVYQPLQNVRQHFVRQQYKNTFLKAAKVFWLPTFLTREKPEYEILTPADLIQEMANAEIAEPAEMNDELAAKLRQYRDDGYLILCDLTGENDEWARKVFRD